LAVGASIEKNVRGMQIEHSASDVCDVVTISIGVAAALPERGDDAARLLALADAQLYGAKHGGRGRTCGAVLGAKAWGVAD
jgi:PleD family two-component response regulator